MTITKEMLDSYLDMQGYVDDLGRKVERLAREIDNLQKRLTEIENGEIVVDSVKGGNGGIQTFKIEGVPTKEYHEKKTRLLLKKMSYEELSPLYHSQQRELLDKTTQIEKFILGIQDILVKRIVNLRFIENMSWGEVASVIGGGNTEDSVKKTFYRYMDKIKLS